MQCYFDHRSLMLLAERQEALWTRRQALDSGAGYELIRSRVKQGTWIDHGHGVFGPPGVPWTHRRWLWRAHLIAGRGSVVSHEAAAVLHRMEGFSGEPVVVTRSHGGWSRLDGVTVHQIDDCRPHHRTRRQGLPVTTPVRTVLDLATVVGRARLEIAVEEELARGRVSVAGLAALLEEVARPGKPGVTRLQNVLDRQVGNRPSVTRLEWLMDRVLESLAGIRVVREIPLPSRGECDGRVDFALPEFRIVIEVDGRRWHERRRDMIRDRDRDNAAASAGWLTLRFMWEHVVEDPDGVARTIRSVCDQRTRP